MATKSTRSPGRRRRRGGLQFVAPGAAGVSLVLAAWPLGAEPSAGWGVAVLAATMSRPPMRTVGRDMLCAMTLRASHAAFAPKRPEGRRFKPTPYFRSRIAFSTTAACDLVSHSRSPIRYRGRRERSARASAGLIGLIDAAGAVDEKGAQTVACGFVSHRVGEELVAFEHVLQCTVGVGGAQPEGLGATTRGEGCSSECRGWQQPQRVPGVGQVRAHKMREQPEALGMTTPPEASERRSSTNRSKPSPQSQGNLWYIDAVHAHRPEAVEQGRRRCGQPGGMDADGGVAAVGVKSEPLGQSTRHGRLPPAGAPTDPQHMVQRGPRAGARHRAERSGAAPHRITAVFAERHRR